MIETNNDLKHRLDKVKEFLAEGRKVEIVLARKRKRAKVPTPEQCQEVMDKIKEAVEEVKGAKFARPTEGTIGVLATVFLEGPKPSASA